MELQEKMAIVRDVKARLRINKVVCTRSVKGAKGDVFVGYSASGWNTTQEDAGHGTGLTETLGEEDERINTEQQGMTVLEARVAGLLLGSEVDTLAYDRAMAGSVVRAEVRTEAINTIHTNYNKLLNDLLDDQAPAAPKVEPEEAPENAEEQVEVSEAA